VLSSEKQDESLTLPAWDTVTNREKFCSVWVLPQTRRAVRYISLYRQLLREGFVIDDGDRRDKTDPNHQLMSMESCMTHL